MNSISIAFQSELSYQLPEIPDHKDYADFKNLIERMGEMLNLVRFDLDFAAEHIKNLNSSRLAEGQKALTAKQIAVQTKHALLAYRCTMAGILFGRSYREMSITLAESPLLQKFCHIARIGGVLKVPTKSTLQRYATTCSEEFIRGQVAQLNNIAFGESNSLNFDNPINSEDVFVDATCLKANIHFPVDWVLMKDCMHTILESILVIRKHGLKHRIKAPEIFISEINAICMSMTSANHKRESKKARKGIFRRLKKMAKIIGKHGQTYMELLKNFRDQTDLSEAQAACIVQRLDKMITTLPVAVEQANSRIISGQLVKNEDKLLSVYHEDVNVISRGKAGAQLEFGNTLFIAEQNNGIILDWTLYQTDVKEVQATKESVTKMTEKLEYEIASLTGDRGCQSKANDKLLADKKIYNGLCPRNPHEFVERMQDEKFRKLQKRRARTEARIGILKHAILDGSLYEKNFTGKELKVAWAILVHNFWCMARLPVKEKELSQAA